MKSNKRAKIDYCLDESSLFLYFPFEIYENLSLFLDIQSIYNLIKTCKTLNKCFTNSIIWKKLYHKYYGSIKAGSNYRIEFEELMRQDLSLLNASLKNNINPLSFVTLSNTNKPINKIILEDERIFFSNIKFLELDRKDFKRTQQFEYYTELDDYCFFENEKVKYVLG